jgi:hypothetical protein
VCALIFFSLALASLVIHPYFTFTFDGSVKKFNVAKLSAFLLSPSKDDDDDIEVKSTLASRSHE